MRAGLIVLISAAFLAAGAQATIALADLPAAGTTASGTTGVQSATTCPTPRMKGLPKRPKFTNATIHFKLTNLTVGASYLISAGNGEVLGGAAQTPTVTSSFLLPDQGTKDHKTTITAVIDTESCTNAPWKVQKKIPYKAVTAATPATPAAPATPDAGKTPAPAPTPAAGLPAVKPIKPGKLPKPITEKLPDPGAPVSQRTWMVPIDGASRLEQRLAEPKLGRLERKSDKASSSNALVGLGIVFALFFLSTVGGLMAFIRRDETQFEAAMAYQLKHLDEGDPGVLPDDQPEAALLAPIEEAPFADPEQAVPEQAVPEQAIPEPAVPELVANGAADPEPASAPEDLTQHRAEVEAQLQRVLNEAGLEAELQGILADARGEAERQGIALDTDLMLQALCEEINGSAKLSDVRREQLRRMFADIIAEEEAQTASATEGVTAS